MSDTIERRPEQYGPHGPKVATLFGRMDYKVYRTGYSEEEAQEYYVPAFFVKSPQSKYFLYYTQDGKRLTVSSASDGMFVKLRGYKVFKKEGMEFTPVK